jgi:TonB family protein
MARAISEQILNRADSRASRVLVVLCFLLTYVVHTALGVHAQNQSQRKLITSAAPKYPESLRTQQLGGIVRLKVAIAPEGNVKSVTAISGNQVLVDAAIEAVKQWKFAPSNSTDSSEIQFDFRPTEK